MRKVLSDGFEGTFWDWEGIAEVTIPEGWRVAWASADPPEAGKLHRPEWDKKDQQAGQPEVWEGDQAVSVHTRSATHDTALWRLVTVEPGPVILSAMGMMKSSDRCGHGLQVGIDPLGGTDFRADSVVWGPWYSQYMPEYERGAWQVLDCRAEAQTRRVTVFLRSKSDWPGDLAAGHFDLVEVWDTGFGWAGGLLEGLQAIRLQVGEVLAAVDEVIGMVEG